MGNSMTWKAAKAAACALLLSGAVWVLGGAQGRDQDYDTVWRHLSEHRQPPKDTEFVFARVRFRDGRGSLGGYGFGFGKPGWAHDYPAAEEHILQVASEATGVNLRKDSYGIVDLESEELFNYPFLYFSEAGMMGLTDQEERNLREHLNRGGFAVIDDFEGRRNLERFRYAMKRVFPEREMVELTIEHPVFHTFYEIPTLELTPPYGAEGPPKLYGYFDERGRLCVILNHDTDLGDFWEWVDQPRFPLQPSTEALRLGINYFLYSMTH